MIFPSHGGRAVLLPYDAMRRAAMAAATRHDSIKTKGRCKCSSGIGAALAAAVPFLDMRAVKGDALNLNCVFMTIQLLGCSLCLHNYVLVLLQPNLDSGCLAQMPVAAKEIP